VAHAAVPPLVCPAKFALKDALALKFGLPAAQRNSGVTVVTEAVIAPTIVVGALPTEPWRAPRSALAIIRYATTWRPQQAINCCEGPGLQAAMEPLHTERKEEVGPRLGFLPK
jgi:hypothetical protein